MDDKELTQLAAKASGMNGGEWFDTLDGPVFVFGSTPFDPLHNDGDALRLAVKLNIHMGLEDLVANAWQGGMRYWQTVRHDGDPCAATRRAIVKVAAAIVKTPNIK